MAINSTQLACVTDHDIHEQFSLDVLTLGGDGRTLGVSLWSYGMSDRFV
jgi:hypothetical protein